MDEKTLLQLAADELTLRSLRYREIEILDYIPSQPDRALLCPVGAVRIFVAAQGDPILQRVRDIIAHHNDGDVDLVENEIAPRFAGRTTLPIDQLWHMLQHSPVFASIRYGGRTLATNVVPPPDLGLVVLDNPYNGGELSPAHLTLVEHLAENTDAALDAVALRQAPPLTPAERAAVALVPADQLEANLAIRGSCAPHGTFIVVTALAFTAAILCAAAATPAEEQQQHLSDEQIQQLGPAATARQLLDIRRAALEYEH
ncbi:hypothetical protein [Nocardia aurantia]|uniref:Uncharacterized protein n=1 Tax=Nocardia aurantia TaxID=2585199 RepID=A0A7K0DZI9_9NOCA|nr:hypothetical protein [Nocardia aurantia]MQY31219.1 hypothetical protein [Nocardia aurantia]